MSEPTRAQLWLERWMPNYLDLAYVELEETFEQAVADEVMPLRTQLAAARAESEALRGERDEAAKDRDEWYRQYNVVLRIAAGKERDGDAMESAKREYALVLALGECVEALRRYAMVYGEADYGMHNSIGTYKCLLCGNGKAHVGIEHHEPTCVLHPSMPARFSERWAKVGEVVEAACKIKKAIDLDNITDELYGELSDALHALDAQEVNGE